MATGPHDGRLWVVQRRLMESRCLLFRSSTGRESRLRLPSSTGDLRKAFHTIAALVYHMNYYVSATLSVLRGGALDARDRFRFDLPPIQSPQAWDELLKKTWDDAEDLAS